MNIYICVCVFVRERERFLKIITQYFIYFFEFLKVFPFAIVKIVMFYLLEFIETFLIIASPF